MVLLEDLMLHIAHVSHQGFHSHRRSKSIYLKCLMKWNLSMFSLLPQTVQIQYYYWEKPISLSQNYDLTFRKWFARRQSSLYHLLPQSGDVPSPRHNADLLVNRSLFSMVVENCAGKRDLNHPARYLWAPQWDADQSNFRILRFTFNGKQIMSSHRRFGGSLLSSQ